MNEANGMKETIVKFDAPVSTTPTFDKYGSAIEHHGHEKASKTEEMLNSMIPPR